MWSALVDWIFGRGKQVLRKGPAHSSDRHGFWRDLWKLRRVLDVGIEHSGSVDIYDYFGCAPYNDNDVKRERRDRASLVLRRRDKASWVLKMLCTPEAVKLLAEFEMADRAKRWRGA